MSVVSGAGRPEDRVTRKRERSDGYTDDASISNKQQRINTFANPEDTEYGKLVGKLWVALRSGDKSGMRHAFRTLMCAYPKLRLGIAVDVLRTTSDRIRLPAHMCPLFIQWAKQSPTVHAWIIPFLLHNSLSNDGVMEFSSDPAVAKVERKCIERVVEVLGRRVTTLHTMRTPSKQEVKSDKTKALMFLNKQEAMWIRRYSLDWNISFRCFPNAHRIDNKVFHEIDGGHSVTSIDISGMKRLCNIGNDVFTGVGFVNFTIGALKNVTVIGDSFLARCACESTRKECVIDLSLLRNLRTIGDDFGHDSERLCVTFYRPTKAESAEGGSRKASKKNPKKTSIVSIGDRFMRGARLVNGLGIDISGLHTLRYIGNSFYAGALNIVAFSAGGTQNLVSIGDDFLSYTNVGVIDLSHHKHLRNIGANFARDCHYLYAVKLGEPEQLKIIQDNFLYNCPVLRNIDLSGISNVKVIGDNFMAFEYTMNHLDVGYWHGFAYKLPMGFRRLAKKTPPEDQKGHIINTISIEKGLRTCVGLPNDNIYFGSLEMGVTDIGDKFLANRVAAYTGPHPNRHRYKNVTHKGAIMNLNTELVTGAYVPRHLDLRTFTRLCTIGHDFLAWNLQLVKVEFPEPMMHLKRIGHRFLYSTGIETANTSSVISMIKTHINDTFTHPIKLIGSESEPPFKYGHRFMDQGITDFEIPLTLSNIHAPVYFIDLGDVDTHDEENQAHIGGEFHKKHSMTIRYTKPTSVHTVAEGTFVVADRYDTKNTAVPKDWHSRRITESIRYVDQLYKN